MICFYRHCFSWFLIEYPVLSIFHILLEMGIVNGFPSKNRQKINTFLDDIIFLQKWVNYSCFIVVLLLYYLFWLLFIFILFYGFSPFNNLLYILGIYNAHKRIWTCVWCNLIFFPFLYPPSRRGRGWLRWFWRIGRSPYSVRAHFETFRFRFALSPTEQFLW